MERDEERSCIEGARRGDADAAAALVRRHQRSLYAYIVRMCGRHHLAEDVVQEAFVRAFSNLDRFDFRFRFSTWLFTIGRRVYLNQAQKMKPRPDSDLIAQSPKATNDEQSNRIDREDTARADSKKLRDAMAHLSRDQREILTLFHQHEWPIALIADHLGMPEGTIKSHLHRGRRRLRDILTQAEQVADHSKPGSEVEGPPHLRLVRDGVKEGVA